MRLGRLLLPLLMITNVAQAAELPLLDFVAIIKKERQSNDCALTFDDGPGEHTPILLDLLQSQDIKATFFVLGKRVRQRPEVIQRMVAEGHEVENHSYDHPDMRRLTKAARQKQIADTLDLLAPLGVKPRYFRPPYGLYNSKVTEDLRLGGMSLVLWSHDSQDWHIHTAEGMEGQLLPVTNRSARGIFLFHDVHDSTIAAMPDIIADLKGKGCNFVTVDQWVQNNIVNPPATPRAAPPLIAQPEPMAAPLPVVQPVSLPVAPATEALPPQPTAPLSPQPAAAEVLLQPAPPPAQLTVKDMVAKLILSWRRPASAVQ